LFKDQHHLQRLNIKNILQSTLGTAITTHAVFQQCPILSTNCELIDVYWRCMMYELISLTAVFDKKSFVPVKIFKDSQ